VGILDDLFLTSITFSIDIIYAWKKRISRNKRHSSSKCISKTSSVSYGRLETETEKRRRNAGKEKEFTHKYEEEEDGSVFWRKTQEI
jgi:hypothetical protein